jgi:UDP-2,3-diacylglucosamine pyrophosphatase LpxH
MATTGMTLSAGAWPYQDRAPWTWQELAHRRLDAVLRQAPIIPFDDSARFVFFSDCHRGDRSPADAFAPNSALFAHALAHYESQGFAYVEVGDGDELWKNRRLDVVQRAHAPVFELLHRLHNKGRLHLVVGNHDIQNGDGQRLEKGGLVAVEGLRLRHAKTGRDILVTHGHQVDLCSDTLSPLSRMVVRKVWRSLQLLGVGRGAPEALATNGVPFPVSSTPGWLCHKRERIERHLQAWLRQRRQMMICGHTHRARLPDDAETPYFNCGSCTSQGYITGLELVDGCLSLVRWSGASGQGLVARRQLVAPPHSLHGCWNALG